MTTKPNDGGPAFPINWTASGTYRTDVDGMSLRDWFAGQAMQGFLSQAFPPDRDGGWSGWGDSVATALNKHQSYVSKSIADFSYQMADAMLASRAHPENPV